jgi:hypothetical protein
MKAIRPAPALAVNRPKHFYGARELRGWGKMANLGSVDSSKPTVETA